MAPIRRYLRITRFSVLEVRIYLDNPADAYRWLLTPSDPALPRVIDAVRPLVLPKLREENERSAPGKSNAAKKKNKSVKDVVLEEDFDVSIYLTETSRRHSLLVKEKSFGGGDGLAKAKKGAKGLVGESGMPIEVEDDGEDGALPGLRAEDSEEKLDLSNIPTADEDGTSQKGTKRARDEGDDSLFVSSDSSSGGEIATSKPRTKRARAKSKLTIAEEDEENGSDDKKKMALNTSYEGFSIYGRILCLVITRKGGKGKQAAVPATSGAGKAMMEDWISSTQVDQPMVDLE